MAKPLDTTAMPAERGLEDIKGKDGKPVFPNLGTNYEVRAVSDVDYNCIGFTIGKGSQDTNRSGWVNPVTSPGATNDDKLKGMDKIYGDAGFTRQPGMNTQVEPGKVKVVVYATVDDKGNIIKVTHGAIQNSDGTWDSKLGEGPVIRHPNPEAVGGGLYGKPIAVYTK